MKRIAYCGAKVTVDFPCRLPGQTVTVAFGCTGNPQKAISVRICFSFNENVFEFGSAENISKDILKGNTVVECGRLLLKKGLQAEKPQYDQFSQKYAHT